MKENWSLGRRKEGAAKPVRAGKNILPKIHLLPHDSFKIKHTVWVSFGWRFVLLINKCKEKKLHLAS